MSNAIPVDQRLIVALDVSSLEEARRYVEDLHGFVSFFKIGLELFLAVNADFIKELRDRRCQIFLDLKLNDIDETVRRTVHLATSLGIDFLTILGNHATAKAAVLGKGRSSLKILTVPLLSSWSERDLQSLMLLPIAPGQPARFQTLDAYVLWRAESALEEGCDGLIASGRYVRLLRERFGDHVLIVSPGVRLSGQDAHEHQRSLTPSEAMRAGADYIVVGRPIRDAGNRREIVKRIIDEMGEALATNPSVS